MESDLVRTLAGLIQRVSTLVRDDPEVRSHLRALARLTVAALTSPETPAQASPVSPPEASVEEPPPPPPLERAETLIAAPEPPPVSAEELRTAMLSSSPEERAPAAAPPGVPEAPDAELVVIEQRCRMKAEGARWAARRRRRLEEGADFQLEIEPLDRRIIEKAKGVPDCFLWMNHPSGPSPSHLERLDVLAGCFGTTADAIALVRGLLDEPGRNVGPLEPALQLLAEAQSGLRVAVDQVGNRQDQDQFHAYLWLRGACWREQVYLPRYMRINDLADPETWPSLGDRIEALDAQVQEQRQQRKRRGSRFKRAEYHQNLLLSKGGVNPSHDWDVFIRTIEEMVQDGAPPSSIDLRDLVLPLVDRLPERDLPANFELVLREVDRYLAASPAGQPAAEEVEPTEEVRQVARWLAGRTLVLIGGLPRPLAREAIRRAFDLREVDWIDTREHESCAPFESHVARPEVALVMLAIRWASHSFGNVKQFCDLYGKPLVRLPAGYNPAQVAFQIVQQCGEQISSRAPAEAAPQRRG